MKNILLAAHDSNGKTLACSLMYGVGVDDIHSRYSIIEYLLLGYAAKHKLGTTQSIKRINDESFELQADNGKVTLDW